MRYNKKDNIIKGSERHSWKIFLRTILYFKYCRRVKSFWSIKWSFLTCRSVQEHDNNAWLEECWKMECLERDNSHGFTCPVFRQCGTLNETMKRESVHQIVLVTFSRLLEWHFPLYIKHRYAIDSLVGHRLTRKKTYSFSYGLIVCSVSEDHCTNRSTWPPTLE